MSRLHSLPSMPRGLILFYAVILTNHFASGTRNLDSSSLQDLFAKATRMPGKYFMSETDQFREEQQLADAVYYEYGANEYDYDSDYFSRMLANKDAESAKKLPELPSSPCVVGSPCPNSTDNQSDHDVTHEGNDDILSNTTSSDIDENEPWLPDQYASNVGGVPLENSTETQNDSNPILQQQVMNDNSPRATLEEVPHDKSAPPKKAPCKGGSSCPSARISREEMERSVYERVRINILKQLNMKEPPNVSARDVDLSSPPIQRILRKHGIKDHRRLNEELVKDDNGEDMTAKETVISSAKSQRKYRILFLLLARNSASKIFRILRESCNRKDIRRISVQ